MSNSPDKPRRRSLFTSNRIMDRLKQDWLDEELSELQAVNARIDGLERAAQDEDRFRALATRVMADALRDAGAEDAPRLANALAPHIVKTIKQEIGNSQPELIDALRPKLGALIKASIETAIADLNRKVDEALPFDRWMAAAKARVSGAPSAGLIIGSAPFSVHEAYLIDRLSGTLLAREADAFAQAGPPRPMDEDLLSGMLSALVAFSNDALAEGGGELRRLDLAGESVYLRSSETRILALRCSGVAPVDIEMRLDLLLERAIGVEAASSVPLDPAGLSEVAVVAAKTQPAAASRGGPLGAIAGGLAATLALVWLHLSAGAAAEARWGGMLASAARADPALAGYPMAANPTGGRGVVIEGLVPDQAAYDRLRMRVFTTPTPKEPRLAVSILRGGE